MYHVIRMYKDAYPRRRIIARGLTLEEAQAHCGNPEMWFDGYEETEEAK